MSKKIKIIQTKSCIGYNKKTKATVKALGLKKLNSSVVLNDNDALRGMINKVSHLVRIEEL
tara:strand:+ start:259 stop:441 length:183 start_codon:yes stop_codon:yes gene_type:complete